MDRTEKEILARKGDTSPEAISIRLRAARKFTGKKQNEMAEALELKGTTYNSQEIKGKPTIETMYHFYANYGIDMNFIVVGEFARLDPDLQTSLFEILSSSAK